MELAEYLAAVQSQLGPGTLERRAACEMSRGGGGLWGGGSGEAGRVCWQMELFHSESRGGGFQHPRLCS